MSARSVLITGCSTGIGRATALRLDRDGWTVFAGVRKEADGVALRRGTGGGLTPVIVDVADADSIEKCARVVGDAVGETGLTGLVNNAGITVQGPLEFLLLDDLRRQLEVNVTGQIAVTQAVLPLIRMARGRIVFVGSIAGRTPSAPLIGPYVASKYALEALAESLRLELLPWRIKVSIVEPGSIATEIWDKGDSTFDDVVAALPPEARDLYGATMNRGRSIAKIQGDRGIAPDKVAVKIEHALTASRPRIHYLVGADARARAYVEQYIPKPVRDRVIAKVLRYRSGA